MFENLVKDEHLLAGVEAATVVPQWEIAEGRAEHLDRWKELDTIEKLAGPSHFLVRLLSSYLTHFSFMVA